MPTYKPDASNDEINYLGEMLGHEATAITLMGAVGLGACLSCYGGVGLALVPVLFAVGMLAIAALFIPSHPLFQDLINRKKQAQRREATRDHLIAKIRRQEPNIQEDGIAWTDTYFGYWTTYQRMRERLTGLDNLARSNQTTLTVRDLERLDDATVDFLRLVYARINIRNRIRGQDKRNIEGQIKDLTFEEKAAVTVIDRKRLEKSRVDLERILERLARLPAKEAATAAQLTTMAQTFEDVYHQITADPGGSVASYLQEASERLTIEEELTLAVDEELDELSRHRLAKRANTRIPQ